MTDEDALDLEALGAVVDAIRAGEELVPEGQVEVSAELAASADAATAELNSVDSLTTEQVCALLDRLEPGVVASEEAAHSSVIEGMIRGVVQKAAYSFGCGGYYSSLLSLTAMVTSSEDEESRMGKLKRVKK